MSAPGTAKNSQKVDKNAVANQKPDVQIERSKKLEQKIQQLDD